MPQPAVVGRAKPPGCLESFSCSTCRQRKVKCDRRNPCSNCVRGAQKCSFIAPVRGKRKRINLAKEGLHAKLKRYEQLLESCGVKLEQSIKDDDSDQETVSEPGVEMIKETESLVKSPVAGIRFGESKSSLVTKDGSSRYFDGSLWSNFGDEIRQKAMGKVEFMDVPKIHSSDHFVDSADEHDLLLSTCAKIENLSSFHPTFQVLQQMWTFFLERVDPITRILHLPTFWSSLTNRIESPNDISESLEALIFVFYFVTVGSLDNDECQSIFGEQRSIVLRRYNLAAHQALTNARFLKSSNLTTLQAFALFLLGIRDRHGDILYILSGVAVRLGRRMGLHRDGASLGLSPFETEMRRRLWWYIVHADCLSSNFTGTKPSTDLFLSDTKKPLNIEDQDLDPNMTMPPPERTGITSMVLRLLKCDVLEFLSRATERFSFASSDIFGSPRTTLAERDGMVNQIEDTLERKYLRYTDPSNSLHYFTSIMARAMICKLRIMAHNPRQFADNGIKVPQKEREVVFSNGIKLLEYVNMVLTHTTLRKLMWQVSAGHFWDTLVYVLIEARQLKTGPEVDKIWELVGGLFSMYPQIFAEHTEPIYTVLGDWTLQVWDEHITARRAEDLPEIKTPNYLTAIRRCRKALMESSSKPNWPTENGNLGSPSGRGKFQPTNSDETAWTSFDHVEPQDFSNLLSFDLEPNEWTQLDRLFAGQDNESFAMS